MYGRQTSVLALLQCTAIFACHLKPEVPRSSRSIIEVPTFVGSRFAQEQRNSVVGYDGQCRQMFVEAADDCGGGEVNNDTTTKDIDDYYRGYYSSQPTARLKARPMKLQSTINDDAWWLAVIENFKRNNEQLQQEMEIREEWRKFQWVSNSQ